MFDQIVHCVFKGAGLKLVLVVDHDHGVLVGVVGSETGLGFGHLTTPCPFA